MKTQTLTTAALFAALTAIFSQIAIPLPGLVPINLAMLSVFLCGALLGPKRAALSQLVYVLIGLVGIPVFSGFRAGPATFFGPTGGFLLGYVLSACIVGLLLSIKPIKWMLPLSMTIGLALCYALGTAWFIYSTQSTLSAALLTCVIPFLVGDVLKITTASLVTAQLGILRFAQ